MLSAARATVSYRMCYEPFSKRNAVGCHVLEVEFGKESQKIEDALHNAAENKD